MRECIDSGLNTGGENIRTKEQVTISSLSDRANLNKIVKSYGMITLAVILMDIGVYVFKFPNYFSFGGVTGIAVVLNQILPVSTSDINFVINMLLLVLGFAFLGKSFGIKTAYVTIVSSVLLSVMDKFLPLAAPLTNQTVLELVYAIALPALAAAILFYENASGGGTDILALILKKHTALDTGIALLVIDACIVMVSFFIFDVKTGLYSICGLMAKTLVIDRAMESMKLCKYFTIICSNPEPICRFIKEKLKRTSTVYNAEGAYSHEGKTIILSAMDRRQAVELQDYILQTNPEAFMMITKSSEIIGKGFGYGR